MTTTNIINFRQRKPASPRRAGAGGGGRGGPRRSKPRHTYHSKVAALAAQLSRGEGSMESWLDAVISITSDASCSALDRHFAAVYLKARWVQLSGDSPASGRSDLQ